MSSSESGRIPELASIQTVFKDLEETPFSTGTVPLQASASTIFYRSCNSEGKFVDFTQIKEGQLEDLAQACQPATFGLNQRDLFDETYRKAGKLDATHFATRFSPTDVGIVDIIHEVLLQSRYDRKSIGVELYKLNVYGTGGFFKAHVDTPRSENMFGSLVVIFPTAHEGGSLILRRGSKECTFDSARIVTAESTPHVAFVAFFSDIEHEVTTVSSGYRVTLTYNLYIRDNGCSARFSGYNRTEMALQDALSHLLMNPSFLPTGGRIGFGLSHKYPINPGVTKLQELEKWLKGTDAAIKRVCESLALTFSVQAVYRDSHHRVVLVNDFLKMPNTQIYYGEVAKHLYKSNGGEVVYDFEAGPVEQDDDDEPIEEVPIVWIRQLAEKNNLKAEYLHYGNEGTVDHVYGEICLVAKVLPSNERP